MKRFLDNAGIEYDSDAKLFHGDVVNTPDVITFQGTTVEKNRKDF